MTQHPQQPHTPGQTTSRPASPGSYAPSSGAPAPHVGPAGQPGPYPPAGHGHQPQPPAGPGGLIRFTVQGSVLTNNMVAPTVTINGHRINVPTGGTVPVPAPAGRHHIEVVSQWLRQYGRAAMTVDLQPGQEVDVYYAAPLHQFAANGAIGFTPQKKQGLGLLIGIIVGVVLVITLLFGVLPALLG